MKKKGTYQILLKRSTLAVLFCLLFFAPTLLTTINWYADSIKQYSIMEQPFDETNETSNSEKDEKKNNGKEFEFDFSFDVNSYDNYFIEAKKSFFYILVMPAINQKVLTPPPKIG